MFGFKDFDSVYNSRRVRGLAEIMRSGKNPLKQAKVLSVAQVVALHNLMENKAANFIDRALAAYALLALYGRCRHSDLAAVDCVMLDFDEKGGFIEGRNKAAQNSQERIPKITAAPNRHSCNWDYWRSLGARGH